MERKKNGQVIAIIALSFAILFMSIGFATYASTLNINGTATVSPSNWSVHFDSTSYEEASGSATATSKSIQDTAMTYAVTLNEPGDFYQFSIDVTNDGTFDAVLNSITLSTLTTAQSKYLSYELKYGNLPTYTASATSIGDELAVNATKTVTVKVTYLQPDSSSDLPTSSVDVTLTAALGYDQKVTSDS